YEELEGNSIDSSDNEEFGDPEGYPQSLGERNWRGIFKRTAITVTAISLLLTIGYSGWLIYGGQKKDKDTISAASATKENSSDKTGSKSGALQKSVSKGDKPESSDSKTIIAKNENEKKKEGGLWNRVKSFVSWKKSDKNKEQAKKIQNNDKTDKGKTSVQQKNLSKKTEDPLLKSDNLKNESGLVKFAKDTNDSLNNSVQDAAALTNSMTEEIVDNGADLLDSANDVVDDVVDDLTDVANSFEETAEDIVTQTSNASQELLNGSSFVDNSGDASEGELVVEADEPYEGVSSSSYPNSVPQVADPVATFGETLPRTDDTVGLQVPTDISAAPASSTPNVDVPTTTLTSGSSAPSGAEWIDEPSVSDVATGQDSITSDDLITSLDNITNDASGSYAVLDESPTLSAAKVEEDGWNGSLDDQLDSPNTFQANAPSLDLSPSTNDNLLAEENTTAGPLTLDGNSSNSGALVLDDTLQNSSLALDNVSNDSSLGNNSLDVDAYPSNDFNGDSDSNLLAPLATAGAPTVEDGLDE
ncbi:MAG: hypothetical protein J6X44_01935, partial [Thermoguttaceae bacterium]|nr:hypothetical protein [Thermoguttaceae bacterium]